MFLSAYITLPGYHVTFLWHHWDHWDNLSSPSSNLIEPCWHTVISCVFGKICGPNLRCHEFGPGLLMANSYGQFTFSCSVSNIIKSEPSCTSQKPRASYQRWQVGGDLVHGKCPHAATQSYTQYLHNIIHTIIWDWIPGRSGDTLGLASISTQYLHNIYTYYLHWTPGRSCDTLSLVTAAGLANVLWRTQGRVRLLDKGPQCLHNIYTIFTYCLHNIYSGAFRGVSTALVGPQ